MRTTVVLLTLALSLGSDAGALTPSLSAQAPSPRTSPPTTLELTPQGGWAGPCDAWWDTPEAVEYRFNAMRVCRVTSFLIQAFQPKPDAQAARDAADGFFRICWGVFPKAGNDCRTPNAWAGLRSWTTFLNQAKQPAPRWGITPPITLPPPIVITLTTSEVLQSDDEVAFVLAHEMGHANDPEPIRPNDRGVEKRADVLGVGFLVMAGFDARAGGRSLQNLGGERGRGGLVNLFNILNNHVSQAMTQDAHGFTVDRIAAMKDAYRRGCAAMNNRPIGCKQGWN